MQGRLHRDRGDHAGAIAAFTRGLALLPHDPSLMLNLAETHYNLGRLLLDEGRDAEAIACFEQTVAVNPRHVLALNNWGHLLKKQAEAAEGEAARGLYDRAAEKTALAVASDHTHDPRIIRNLAEIHLARKDYAAAVAAYEQALAAIAEHDPKRGFGRLMPDYTHALQRAKRLAADPQPTTAGDPGSRP